MAQAISAHPNFQTTSTLKMNVLSSGTDDITYDNGQTIGSVSVQTVSAQSFTNITVIYRDLIFFI